MYILQGSNPQKQYKNPEKSKKPNFEKRYPYSGDCISLSKPCPYCDYGRGLIIIRFKDDLGFVRCGRCDAALFSLNEISQKQGLQHIGTVLDSYLPRVEEAQ